MKKRFYFEALALLGALIVQFLFGSIICCTATANPMLESLEMIGDKINLTIVNDNIVRKLKTIQHIIAKSNESTRTERISYVYDTILDNKIEESIKRTKQNIQKIRNIRTKRVREMRFKKNSTLERNERSANLSHISGSTRKIQLYIKNRFLQLMPDGGVNGTSDDSSDYTILQRTTVNVGLIKIQGVSSCLFLCMDQCGVVYGSVEFTDDCVFNESIEQHHYNTYSSTYNSNAKRTFYLGLNRHGQPRKIQIPTSRQLGKLSTYTKSLTQTVSQERVDQLIARLYGKNHLRHGLKQLCESEKQLHNQDIRKRKNKLKCKNLKNSNKAPANKRKKKKRKCRIEETESDQCNNTLIENISKNYTTNNNKKRILSKHNQKTCNLSLEECNNNKNNNKKTLKKGFSKKDGSHSKFNNESINLNKIKLKNNSSNASTVLKENSTLKSDYFEHDIMNDSDEFNNEDNYEDFIPRNTANFIDESEIEDN